MPLSGAAKTEAQRRRRERQRHEAAERASKGVRASGRHEVLAAARDALKGEVLTPRQELAATALLSGASVTEAAELAGYKSHSALRPGSAIRTAATEALIQVGATRHSAALVVRQSLKAKDTHFFKFNETQFQKKSIEKRDVVAHGHRLDAAKLVFQLHGDLGQNDERDRERQGGPVVGIQILVAEHPVNGENGTPGQHLTSGIHITAGGNGHTNGH